MWPGSEVAGMGHLSGLPARFFGVDGVGSATARALSIAFSTSIAVVMGMQLVYPTLPAMMQQLQVGEAAIGLVVTAYTLPAVFLTPFAGAIADLYGRRPLLFGGLLVFGLGGAAVALAPTFELVLVGRVIQGIGATGLMPLTIVLLSDLVAEERESSVQGMKVVLDRVAMTVAPVLAGVLAVASWRFPFLLYLLALPVALLGLAWLPETRPDVRPSARAYASSFAVVRHRPRLLLAFAAGSLRFFLDYGYFTYLPIYLALARGTTPDVVGLLFAAFAAGAMITASQAGRLTRGHDPARVVVVGFLLAGLSVLAIPFLPGDGWVAASLFVYGLGNGIISPLQKGLLTRNAPAEVRGGVVSLDRVLQQIAKTLAPAAMGLLLVVADVSAVFWLLGALSLGSVLLAAGLLTSRGWDGVQPAPAQSTG
jgi:MFS transporter, ACDE family, multidrug resistance protein